MQEFTEDVISELLISNNLNTINKRKNMKEKFITIQVEGVHNHFNMCGIELLRKGK